MNQIRSEKNEHKDCCTDELNKNGFDVTSMRDEMVHSNGKYASEIRKWSRR